MKTKEKAKTQKTEPALKKAVSKSNGKTKQQTQQKRKIIKYLKNQVIEEDITSSIASFISVIRSIEEDLGQSSASMVLCSLIKSLVDEFLVHEGQKKMFDQILKMGEK